MSGSRIRMVLLGKTGTGKSSLANTILKESVFRIYHTSESGTSECQTKSNKVHGRTITLTDTPGFIDTKKSEEELKPAIIKCITDCSPGPHVFLILLKVERFTDHEDEVISKIKKSFSEEAFKYTVVVFTHGDQLDDDMKIEEFVGKNDKLRDLLEKCGGRCHVVDNKYWNKQEDGYRSNKVQVEALLNTIDRMMEENRGRYYTNEMLQEVERMIQEEKENIRQKGGNMSEEEIGEKAKRKVRDILKKIEVTTSILLEVFLGVSVGPSIIEAIKRRVSGKGRSEAAQDVEHPIDATGPLTGHHAGSEAIKNTATHRRIVLLGKCGAGKSSLANTIMGETVFETHHGHVGTSKCQTVTNEVYGRTITLTDTPGFSHSHMSDKNLKSAIMKCITDCSPGPHAFLIVLKVERFTETEKEVISKITEFFSEEVFKYAVVVFTHGDQLDDDMKIEKFVCINEKLSDLLEKCGNRCHVVDNKYWKNQQDGYRSNKVQVEALLNTIDRMMEENGGRYYINEMFREVERMIQEEEEENIRQKEENMCIIY